MYPRQRPASFVMSRVGTDLVIFDPETAHLHTLPAPVAAVWQACDGTADVTAIAASTGLTLLQVEAALLQLREATLVEPEPEAAVPSSRDRRTLLKRAALGAAMVSVTAPMAVQAQSAGTIACATFPSVFTEDYCANSGFGTYDCVEVGCPAETWYFYYEYSYLYDDAGEFVTDTWRYQCEGQTGAIIATTAWTPIDASGIPYC